MNSLNTRITFLFFLNILSLCIVIVGQPTNNDKGEIWFQTAIARIHELDTAIRYFEMAKPLLKEESSWENYVNCLNALHYCYFEKDDYVLAERYANEAFKEAQKYLNRRASAYSYALNNLGTIYTRKSDYLNAIHCFQQSLEIMEMNNKSSTLQKAALADAYSNIGTLLAKTGQYETALTYVERSFDLKVESLPKGNKDPLLAKTYRILADILLKMENKKEALKYLNEISNLLVKPKSKEEKRQLLRHYHFLIEYFIKEGAVEKADKYLEKVEQIQRKDIYRPFRYYHLKAKLSLFQENYLKAKEFLKLSLSEEGFLKDEQAILFRELGDVYMREGNHQTALSYYEQALKNLDNQHVEEAIPFPLTELSTYKRRGEVLLHLRSWKKIVQNTQSAEKIIQYLRRRYRVLGEKLKLAEISQSLYDQGIAAAYELYMQDLNSHWLEIAFSFSERTKANILFESLMHSAATFQLPDSLRERENQLRIDIDFQEKILFESVGNQLDSLQLLKTKRRLFELRQQYNILLEKLESEFSNYFDEKYNDSIPHLSSLQKMLKKREICMSYFWGNAHLYIFRIEERNIRLFRIEIRDELIKNINSFREQVSKSPLDSTSNAEIYMASAWNLTKSLFPEFEASAYAKINSFVIIPDGLLSYLPFESFLSKAPEMGEKMRYQELPYMVKNYTFSYQYSANLWMRFKQKKHFIPDKKALWAGYAPTYSIQQVISLNQQMNFPQVAMRDESGFLPFAIEEVKEISELLKGKSFLYEQASEASFKNESRAFSILHLATHGLLKEENPLYSQLLFSQVSDSLSEDGMLQAYELYNMKLNADLIVLSACNTGTGKLQKGEGVLSLSRAFSAAACRSILFSLWQVSDQSTSRLMIGFYKNLISGARKDQALQKAQISYILTQDENLYAHPYYWAGFVPTGDMSPLDISEGLKQICWWLFLGFGGILVGFILKNRLNRN